MDTGSSSEMNRGGAFVSGDLGRENAGCDFIRTMVWVIRIRAGDIRRNGVDIRSSADLRPGRGFYCRRNGLGERGE